MPSDVVQSVMDTRPTLKTLCRAIDDLPETLAMEAVFGGPTAYEDACTCHVAAVGRLLARHGWTYDEYLASLQETFGVVVGMS